MLGINENGRQKNSIHIFERIWNVFVAGFWNTDALDYCVFCYVSCDKDVWKEIMSLEDTVATEKPKWQMSYLKALAIDSTPSQYNPWKWNT